MITAYEFNNYRKFLSKKISEMPKKGYGQLSNLARKIGVHTTLLSQVLNGQKELTTDQAAALADHFGMNDLESEYFVLLVQLERAGNPSAKKLFNRQLQKLKEKASNISVRVKSDVKLTEEQRAIFYCDWIYSAIRQAIAILKNPDSVSISDYLGLTPKKVQNALDFLLQTGLCKVVNGKLTYGPTSTHLEDSSPWIKVHHWNWRQKSMTSLEVPQDADLHYTAPMTLSKKDAELIKEKIIQFIEEVNLTVDSSPSETLVCMNIDWFQVEK